MPLEHRFRRFGKVYVAAQAEISAEPTDNTTEQEAATCRAASHIGNALGLTILLKVRRKPTLFMATNDGHPCIRRHHTTHPIDTVR